MLLQKSARGDYPAACSALQSYPSAGPYDGGRDSHAKHFQLDGNSASHVGQPAGRRERFDRHDDDRVVGVGPRPRRFEE